MKKKTKVQKVKAQEAGRAVEKKTPSIVNDQLGYRSLSQNRAGWAWSNAHKVVETRGVRGWEPRAGRWNVRVWRAYKNWKIAGADFVFNRGEDNGK